MALQIETFPNAKRRQTDESTSLDRIPSSTTNGNYWPTPACHDIVFLVDRVTAVGRKWTLEIRDFAGFNVRFAPESGP